MNSLRTVLMIAALVILTAAPVWAQDAGDEFEDIDAVEQVEPAADGVMLMQLYSSESCPFCPAAERNLNDLTADPSIIGVTCMVDYFDSGKPSILARPFCQAQQDVYVHMLRTGSNYTPMLVLNGKVQMPGQDLSKVSKGVKAVREGNALPASITISIGHETGDYDALLPDVTEGSGKYVLRITMVKHAPDADLFSSAVQQVERRPHNVATSLIEGGIWDGKRRVWSMKPKPDGIADGFIVTVQDQASGVVLAAGQADLVVTKSK